MKLRFTILNVTGIAIVAALFIAGVGEAPFRADQTGLTFLIAAVFLIGLWLVWQERWGAVRWIGGTLVFLGLLGTVVGFIVALSGVDPQKAGDVAAISPMVSALLRGMATALYTTLVGSVAYLWLSVNAYVLAQEEI